ncbi:MAG: hypothetical protein M1825_002126 [Sarcosagium campestre]|nr:MAG: hypothetical protein M1825_002126 [Sarcosagium campestre]
MPFNLDWTKTLGLSVWMVVLFVTLAMSQSSPVIPSNNTDEIPDNGRWQMVLTVAQDRSMIRAELQPLNQQAQRRPAADFTGSLILTTESNSLDINDNQIPYISCEASAFPGDVTVGEAFRNAASRNPIALVLYSTQASHCSLTDSIFNDLDPRIFTMTTRNDSERFESELKLSDPAQGQARASREDAPDDNGNNTQDGSSRPNNVLGPSPTTAVAMIILYSITGVITALFLIIIVTGAIRAHRHPERYGPRLSAGGRPRQSRAKGIARAMLETIPIVKFGEKEDDKPPQDVEMTAARGAAGGETANGIDQTDGTGRPLSEEAQLSGGQASSSGQHAKVASETEQDVDAIAALRTSSDGADRGKALDNGTGIKGAAVNGNSVDQNADSGLGCSICTEDFVKGEDVRVLPCDHQYHPACIDPWLLNVSGTCPLCRIDLRPQKTRSHDGSETQDAAHDNTTTTGSSNTNNNNNNNNSLDVNSRQTDQQRNDAATMGFLEEHLGISLQAEPQERIAALRRLREENRDDETGGSGRRRKRLSGILRNSWRRSSRIATPEPPSDEQQHQNGGAATTTTGAADDITNNNNNTTTTNTSNNSNNNDDNGSAAAPTSAGSSGEQRT